MSTRQLVVPVASPRHHIITSGGIGGHCGKSKLLLHLSAYLLAKNNTRSVLVMDMVAPQKGVYELFGNIFKRPTERHTQGAPYLEFASRVDGRRLVVVDLTEAGSAPWEDQVTSIQNIQHDLMNNGYEISHVITETNLQPDAPGVPALFNELRSSSLHIWTLWLRESIPAIELHESLAEIQDDFPSNLVNWEFVHNPYIETEGRDPSNDYEVMKACFDHVGPDSHRFRNGEFVRLSRFAKDAQERGLDGNDYWRHVYQDFLRDDVQMNRPANLLPIFRRSESFIKAKSRNFADQCGSLEDPMDLAALLNEKSDSMYEAIFRRHFSAIGL